MISEEMIKNAATEADQAIRDSLPAPAKNVSISFLHCFKEKCADPSVW